MIEVRIQFPSLDDAAKFFTRHGEPVNPIDTAGGDTTARPGRKPRKKDDAPPVEATSTAPAATVESLISAPPAERKPPTQKDLIVAFTALVDSKGGKESPNALGLVQSLLQKFNAKSVALIPQDKWAEAIDAANAATK